MIEKLDIAKLEELLSVAFSTVAPKRCFAGDRPKDWQSMKDFVVVSVNGGMGSIKTQSEPISGNCMVLVELYMKDLPSGLKDVRGLQAIRTKLTNLLPYNGEYFRLTYNNEVGSRDQVGFHTSMINLKCLIF